MGHRLYMLKFKSKVLKFPNSRRTSFMAKHILIVKSEDKNAIELESPEVLLPKIRFYYED